MQFHRLTKVFGTLAISGALFFSTLVSAPAAFAVGWSCGPVAAQTTAIDANGSKAAVNVEGTAYVFYQENGSRDLKYARRTTSGWAVETLDGNSTVGGRTTHAVGAGVSAIAAGSYIRVTYIDSTNGDVRWAVRINGVWSFEIAYHATSASTAAGTTALGGPGVFHTQGLGYGGYYKLTYRQPVASGWAEYRVDTNVYAQASIAAVMVGNTLHVWYEKSDGLGGGVLAHAWGVEDTGLLEFHRNVTVYDTWRTQVLDGNGGTRGRTDSDLVGAIGLSVATSGPSQEYPHVFYSDLTRQELRHAWWNGSEWTFETLDGDRTLANGRTDGETGMAPAVVNLNGVLHVFYSGLDTGLRHAWFANQWGYETLDGSTAAAGHCTGYTTQRVFGPTAATVVGGQLYAVSSTNLTYPLLRVAEWR